MRGCRRLARGRADRRAGLRSSRWCPCRDFRDARWRKRWMRALAVSAAALMARANVSASCVAALRQRVSSSWSTTSVAIALATSPAAPPPMPSATMKSEPSFPGECVRTSGCKVAFIVLRSATTKESSGCASRRTSHVGFAEDVDDDLAGIGCAGSGHSLEGEVTRIGLNIGQWNLTLQSEGARGAVLRISGDLGHRALFALRIEGILHAAYAANSAGIGRRSHNRFSKPANLCVVVESCVRNHLNVQRPTAFLAGEFRQKRVDGGFDRVRGVFFVRAGVADDSPQSPTI